MKIALFLGAGASVPFGKPTTKQMKDNLAKYSYKDLDEELLQSFVTNYQYKDIEYVLQAVRDIKKFSQSLGGKYFIEHGKNGNFSYKNGYLPVDTFILKLDIVEKTLENAIYENYRWNHDFDGQALGIYDTIFKILKQYSEDIVIFTTNYDRVIEEYCNNRTEYQCVDGFTRDPPHSELNLWMGDFNVQSDDKLTLVKLYKLHGSLNWKEHVKHGIVKTNEESISTDQNFSKNLVILPTRSPKDEEEESPFTDLLGMFENFMENADACIVVGFSFRDLVINQTLKQFAFLGGQKPLIVISPSAMENVCENLLEFPDTPAYDKNKVSSKAPTVYEIWCIPTAITVENVKHIMDLAMAHIKAAMEKRKNNLSK